jgi:hypothetical protein
MATKERAFAEAQYAVNHWFQFMDDETRAKLAAYAQGWTQETAFQVPVITETAKPVVSVSHGEGRGKANIGKVWMVNKATGQRARVEAGSVDDFQSRGYVRGGPRSV